MKNIKNIGFSILYSLITMLILTFIVTILNYFNIINYKVLNVVLKIILFISFFIGSLKFKNYSKKLIKGSYIVLINLLLVLLISVFTKFNIITFIIVLTSSLLGYIFKNH